MTPKQTTRERAQDWIAGEGFVSAASDAAGVASRWTADAAVADRDVIAPGVASGQRRLVGGVWTDGEMSRGDAAVDSMRQGMDLCDVRLEKVLRLRQAIASGKYRVSAADLADKLIGALTSGSGPDERK